MKIKCESLSRHKEKHTHSFIQKKEEKKEYLYWTYCHSWVVSLSAFFWVTLCGLFIKVLNLIIFSTIICDRRPDLKMILLWHFWVFLLLCLEQMDRSIADQDFLDLACLRLGRLAQVFPATPAWMSRRGHPCQQTDPGSISQLMRSGCWRTMDQNWPLAPRRTPPAPLPTQESSQTPPHGMDTMPEPTADGQPVQEGATEPENTSDQMWEL